VIMGDDRAVITGEHAKKSYSSLAYEINRRFCEKKGWDFRYEKYALPQRPWGVWQGYSREASEHRAPTWIKLLAVHSALQRNHDYVIWIDSDCIFYNHDRSWDAILGEFSNPMLHLIGWLDNPFHSDKFCAGFFIVRNSMEVRNMLKTIWLTSSKFSWAFPYEQHALNAFLAKSSSAFSLFLDEPMFELKSPNQYILHVAGFEHQRRVPSFLEWFEDHGFSPLPLKTEEFVFEDLDVDAYDEMLSNSPLRLSQIFQRECWGLFQRGRQKLKKVYSQFK
jgi:hypothetical protein